MPATSRSQPISPTSSGTEPAAALHRELFPPKPQPLARPLSQLDRLDDQALLGLEGGDPEALLVVHEDAACECRHEP